MEVIQSWHLTAVLVLVGVVAQFAVNKYQNGEYKNQIALLFSKIDKLVSEVNNLKIKETTLITAEKVEATYVRAEVFRQMERNIEEKIATTTKNLEDKIDKVENGIEKILNKLEK